MPDFITVSDTVAAAMIAALTTLATAFLNLRASWKRELKERERGQPITKKSRRGLVLAVLFLMVGSAVGGFAFSQYLMEQDDLRLRNANADTNVALEKILAATERLERAAGGVPRAAEGEVVAAASFAPCKPVSAAGKSAGTCSEQEATQMAVCAVVPAAAQVKEVSLYTRLADTPQSWKESAVAAGQDAGQARFHDKPFEQPDGAGTKQVCQRFAHWNSEQGRVARIVVRFSL